MKDSLHQYLNSNPIYSKLDTFVLDELFNFAELQYTGTIYANSKIYNQRNYWKLKYEKFQTFGKDGTNCRHQNDLLIVSTKNIKLHIHKKLDKLRNALYSPVVAKAN